MTDDEPATTAVVAAGVSIRELAGLDDLDAVCQLFHSIWRPDPANPPATTELLRALTKAGNYLAGAYDGDRLVGACLGFFGAPADETLHSHIAGVTSDLRGRGVGFALKLHQRAWALSRGVWNITWTFDPLVSRNAYVNLVKLAASVVEYLPNHYGRTLGDIDGSDETDRLLVRWALTDPAVVRACAGTPTSGAANAVADADTAVALSTSPEGEPMVEPTTATTRLVEVPRDIEAMRLADPDRARRWRLALRQVLRELLDDGGRVTRFDHAGRYVVATGRGPE